VDKEVLLAQNPSFQLREGCLVNIDTNPVLLNFFSQNLQLLYRLENEKALLIHEFRSLWVSPCQYAKTEKYLSSPLLDPIAAKVQLDEPLIQCSFFKSSTFAK